MFVLLLLESFSIKDRLTVRICNIQTCVLVDNTDFSYITAVYTLNIWPPEFLVKLVLKFETVNFTTCGCV